MNNFEQMVFVSAKPLYTRVREMLKSFDASGLIDEGMFHDYTKYLLDYWGVGAYRPHTAVREIKNFVGALPANFSVIYAGYFLHPTSAHGQRHWVGGSNIVIEKEVSGDCGGITPCEEVEEDCSIVVNTYLDNTKNTMRFANPQLLRLSPQTPHQFVDDHCLSLASRCEKEFYIDRNRGRIQTNFNGWMMLEYYGFPIEENTGLPAIPEDEILQNAIYYYIIKRCLEQWWLNSTVPDMERKLAYFTQLSDSAMADAISYVKLPSFRSKVEMARRRRSMADRYQLNTKQYW